MKKRQWLAAVLLSALVLALGAPGLARAETVTVYHTAVNEQMLPLSADTMPVQVGGMIYVPYTVFDRNVTGVNLGVYYGQDRKDGNYIVTLYTINKLLVFDLNGGTCEDGSGVPQTMRAIIRNGRAYVPISRVCQFFSDTLTYSYNPTDYGILIRICNRSAALSDARFLDAASSMMMSRYTSYIQSITTPSPPASPSATPTPTPTPTRPGTNPRVYLAVRCVAGGSLDQILDIMDFWSVRGLFLFQVDDLEQYAAQIRRIVGTGHALGLITDAADPETALAQLARGNELLSHIAHVRAHTVLADSGDGALRARLEQEGWSIWQENVDGASQGWGQYGLARSVLQAIENRRTYARVTMEDDEVGADALAQVLSELRRERYDVRLAVETAL